MTDSSTRRQLLRAGALAGVAGLAGCKSRPGSESVPSGTASTGSSGNASSGQAGASGGEGSSGRSGPPVDVRGAIYVPTRAYNVYQMWRYYDPKVIERDLGYAQRVNLNAVRIWLSYEYWTEDRARMERSLEHFVRTASEKGIRPLVELFDAVGAEPSQETLTDRDPETAVAVSEPSGYVMRDADRWTGVREYVRWFMRKYRDDDRLLAISVMNEPGWNEMELNFARGMWKAVSAERGSIPLTMGATSLINATDYVDWGADVLQFHYNFPRSRADLRELFADANELSALLEKPVWMSEWQRVRSSGGGFGGSIEGDEWAPKYRTVAPAIREAGVGSFFWSLMVKPAWVPRQRELGAINGLFHEDGAVWSRKDARAIKSLSGDPSYSGPERQHRPEWMRVGGDGGGENESA